MPMNVTYMDGFQLTIDADPALTAAELFEQCHKSIGLKSGKGFALYEISGELGK
jgi:hypothetical protein